MHKLTRIGSYNLMHKVQKLRVTISWHNRCITGTIKECNECIYMFRNSLNSYKAVPVLTHPHAVQISLNSILQGRAITATVSSILVSQQLSELRNDDIQVRFNTPLICVAKLLTSHPYSQYSTSCK